MAGPGPKNSLTDIAGLLVGQAEDAAARTGVSVILPQMRAVASVDVRGGGPGTRETELLRPEAMVPAIDAICLAGGSVYGLDAASGVVQWLARHGRGLAVHTINVPIVPSAILFDLMNGGDKHWLAGEYGETPYRRLAMAACDAASADAVALGNAGAGYGAMAGKLKGGVGSASWVEDDGLIVAALVAANPVGSVLTPGNKGFWAAPFEQAGEFGNLLAPPPREVPASLPKEARIGGHTCIGVVATNAALDKAALRHVATMAHDGLARSIRPVHTPFDGDTLFSLATANWPDQISGQAEQVGPGGSLLPLLIARVGSIAADCVARAVGRAVWQAEPLGALDTARKVALE